MPKFRVMVIKYGFVDVEAETENDAIEAAENMSDHDFDWSDFDEAQVIGEVD